MIDLDDSDEWRELTPEEIRRKDIEAFWEQNKEKCESGSHYRPIYARLLKHAEATAAEDGLDQFEFERRLWEIEEIVDAIADSFKAHWSDCPTNKFWFRWHDDQLVERPKEWHDDSPIHSDSLDAATARYLERPWLQDNLLDWYIINAFVKDVLIRLMVGIMSGSLFGRVNLAYEFSRGKPMKMIVWKPTLSVLGFIYKWLLLPGFAGAAYYFGFEVTAMWIIGFFAVLVFFRIIFLPGRIMRWRQYKKELEKADGMFIRLNQIRLMCQAGTLNPTQLKNKILEAEKDAPLLKSAVHSLLDRAIERDAAVFTTGGARTDYVV